MDQLWNSLYDLFDTDDGSLPDIYLLNLSGQGVKDLWAYLRQSAVDLAPDASFWHIAKDQNIPIDAVPNAAELVVNGEAQSFHAVLQGISFGGTAIPDLGVGVFPDAIYLDYRMGTEWGPAQLGALFELLNRLQMLDRGAVVRLPEDCTVDARKRFAAPSLTIVTTPPKQALAADSPLAASLLSCVGEPLKSSVRLDPESLTICKTL